MTEVIYEGPHFVGYEHPRGMIIKPTAQGIEAAQEVEDHATVDALCELLEFWVGNGWLWIPPEEIGALTDAPIMSMDATVEDDGSYTIFKDGVVYWHSNYMIEDPVEKWARGDGVIWDKA